MNIHIHNPFKGSGSRRATPESHTVLERENRQLRGDAARLDPCECHAPRQHVQFLIRRPTGTTAPERPLVCPACEIDRLRGQLSVLTAPRAPQSPVLVPAAADVPESAFATPEPAVAADPRLRIVADTPAAPVDCEAADVNAETQPVSLAAVRQAVGEGDTTQLPAVPEQGAVRKVAAVTADQLQPAQAPVPPKLPPAHLVRQQRVAWGVKAVDPLACDDLKPVAPATAVLAVPGWRSERVSLSKTG